GKPLFNVKKSRLLHIAIPSVRTGRMESQSWFQNQRVFRTLHLVQAPTEDFKLITKTAQTRHPLLNIKETDLFHIEITTI
ncbi:hypothetical protein, partial [Gluconobacter japonicus]|uniref:hypothetical protein n=1 Tax=Gluconobacter japonicus TaxID=376620 RepID=UPI0024E13801